MGQEKAWLEFILYQENKTTPYTQQAAYVWTILKWMQRKLAEIREGTGRCCSEMQDVSACRQPVSQQETEGTGMNQPNKCLINAAPTKCTKKTLCKRHNGARENDNRESSFICQQPAHLVAGKGMLMSANAGYVTSGTGPQKIHL